MDVILLADRRGQELLPLTDESCPALLPFAGKMVIEHTFEALVEAGLRQAHIVFPPEAENGKEALGGGERWGMRLEISLSRGEEPPLQIFARWKQPPAAPFLILRGDIIRSCRIGDFLKQAEALAAQPCVAARLSGQNAYMLLCRGPLGAYLNHLNWVDPAPYANAEADIPGVIALLDSLRAYHQANLDAAAGRLPSLLIPGRQIALGLTQGRNTEAYPQNLKRGVAWIGSNSHLHPSVELLGEVVIGDNVIIDRRVSIESSVILPHSYIGELVELRNAIVRGNDLIRVDNGAILKITDSFLLADLKAANMNQNLRSVLSRIGGGILLALSLPLWVLAFAASRRQNPAQPYVTRRLRGNKIEYNRENQPQRKEFSVGEWNVDAPALRYLPRLLAVISGDLELIGALPVTMEVAGHRTEEWQKLADKAPAGLLGPTQLNVPADAPEEEKLMSDSFYASNFSPKQDLYYLLQGFYALFSRKAWLRESDR